MKKVRFLLLAAMVAMFTGFQKEVAEQELDNNKPTPTGDTRIIIEGEGMIGPVTRSSDGKVEFEGGYATGAGLYNGDAQPKVAAHPDAGYEVNYFYGGPENELHRYDYAQSGSSTFDVKLKGEDHTFRCGFKEKKRNLTVNTGTGGSVSPAGTNSYRVEKAISITATPDSGYEFAGWTITEGDVTIENPGSPATTATLHNDNSTITANFKSGAELVFTVRASANKIVPMPVLGSGPYIIDYGDGTVAQEVDLRAPGYTQYPGSYHTYSADGEYTVTIKGPAATAFSFRGTRNSDLQYTNPCPAKSILKNTIDISCVTSLENAFSGMKSLESIKCDLFESCKGRVTTCANIFDQCTNLHTIYNGLFEGFDKCTDFSLAFHYTALNSIPANTFRGCSSAVKFNSTFSAIPNILSIPAGLFDDCVNAQENEWVAGGLGILRGVAFRFWDEFPEYCTLPHIMAFIMTASTRQLSIFLQQNLVAEMMAGAYLKAEGSEKTQASYLSTLCNNLSTISQNEEIAYILSGDDFDFNLIDPEDPKLFAISNNFSKNSVYAPVIGMLMSISTRQFTMQNKVPFVYFLDEMTTVNIKNFETLPSVLREYKVGFVLLTQSGAKLEALYGKLDRSSVEANFGIQFFGRTKDVEALKYYPQMFGKEEKERKSRSTGKSGSSSNRSVTISSQKEDIYQGRDFADLEPGEFIGSATRANVRYFKVMLGEFKEKDEKPLPDVRVLEPGEISGNFARILEEVRSLFPCE